MSFFGFSKTLLITGAAAALVAGCATAQKAETTADGQVIPPKKMFQFSTYEYVCEPTLGKNHTEVEHLLDRYGQNGWKLAGFMQKGGDTTAFCLVR